MKYLLIFVGICLFIYADFWIFNHVNAWIPFFLPVLILIIVLIFKKPKK